MLIREADMNEKATTRMVASSYTNFLLVIVPEAEVSAELFEVFTWRRGNT